MQDEGGTTGGGMSCMENACMHGCASVCMYICVFLQDCVCYVCVCVCVCQLESRPLTGRSQGQLRCPGANQGKEYFISPLTRLYSQIHTHTLTHSKTYTQIMT